MSFERLVMLMLAIFVIGLGTGYADLDAAEQSSAEEVEISADDLDLDLEEDEISDEDLIEYGSGEEKQAKVRKEQVPVLTKGKVRGSLTRIKDINKRKKALVRKIRKDLRTYRTLKTVQKEEIAELRYSLNAAGFKVPGLKDEKYDSAMAADAVNRDEEKATVSMKSSLPASNPIERQHTSSYSKVTTTEGGSFEVLEGDVRLPEEKYNLHINVKGEYGYLNYPGLEIEQGYSLGVESEFQFMKFFGLAFGIGFSQFDLLASPFANIADSTRVGQLNIAATGRLYGYDWIVRPFLAGGFAYNHRTYNTSVQYLGYQTDAIDGKVGAGLDISLTRWLTLSGEFNYFMNLGGSEQLVLFRDAADTGVAMEGINYYYAMGGLKMFLF